MAAVLALFSVYLMWKSSELPIGWIPQQGPGGGAFPFWLAVGMLICCIWIIVRWFRRNTVVSRSTEPYLTNSSLKMFLTVSGLLGFMIGAIHIIGVYFSVLIFLLLYIRLLGSHRWSTSILIAVATPVVAFFFFEIALLITLPKGYSEPLFYPLYDWFM
tara:strand:- start:2961 stop:3437 length:477 start_codon:yes stop_codon:yes gene_type:complete